MSIINFIGSTLIGSAAVLADVPAADLYKSSFKTVKRKTVKLSDYKDHTILFVNTASKCGFTGQYKGLQEIYEKYKDKKFVVLAFPSNEFGKQEPGSNKEIAEFCDLQFKTKFPIAEKTTVLGKDRDPIFSFLLSKTKDKNEIAWNFEKFLVTPGAKSVARYPSKTKPTSEKLTAAIEASLKI